VPSGLPAQPAVLVAFFARPPGKGAIAVGGVSAPSGQLAGLPLVVVSNWGDGRETFTGLFAAGGGFDRPAAAGGHGFGGGAASACLKNAAAGLPLIVSSVVIDSSTSRSRSGL
jgi:hypothetical protein